MVGLLKCLLAYLPFFPVTRHFWGSGSGPIGILDMLWEKLKAGSRLNCDCVRNVCTNYLYSNGHSKVGWLHLMVYKIATKF